MADDEKARLLNLLEAHGQSFLSSFPSTSVNKRKRGLPSDSVQQDIEKLDEDEESEAEEWFGVGLGAGSGHEYGDSEDDEDEDPNDSEFEQSDDDFTAGNDDSTVVVFSEPTSKKSESIDYAHKARMKAFMSSKISKLSDTTGQVARKRDPKEEEEDKTNAQNDALLHKLVHTKLLSGAPNTELDLPPAKRRKALAGRVLELTGEAKLGKGEKSIREAEKNKAAKRVREGISSKQMERGRQELEEAKNLGNYHPTLKKVFEASAPAKSIRKREKGLNMGVGKFSGGSLRLSREDVGSVMGNRGRHEGSSGSRRGRGGGRGRGGKRK